MKILYSPSEAKSLQSPINGNLKENLTFSNLFDKRAQVLEKYQQFLNQSSNEKLSKLLGLKKESDINMYKNIDIFNSPLQIAILRYSGVGFNYLDFPSLEDSAKDVILESLLIFSNLFGPIKSSDKIPLYKLKQGEKIGEFVPSKHYKTYFSDTLDEYIGEDLVVDLRAGFYEKFYTPKVPRISMKFLKDGKNINHFSKAYRGLVARALAIYNPKDENELRQVMIPDLSIKEILQKGKNTTFVYEIL